MDAPKPTDAERRAKILTDIRAALERQELLGDIVPSGLDLFGLVHTSRSIARRDVGYAQQEIIPNMREHLGLTERNDIVVKAEYVERGDCVCGEVPCRCAIYRALHVQLYPQAGSQAPPPPPPVNAHALAAQQIDANAR